VDKERNFEIYEEVPKEMRHRLSGTMFVPKEVGRMHLERW
jgi:hypothetical protein